jgi:hypothetical protein
MDVFTSLSDEWSTLESAQATNAHYRRWQEADHRFNRWGSLAELIHFAQRRGDPEASDRALALLAQRSPSDELAARALLQALLPGLRAVVVQHHWLTDHDELTASTVALAWERIRTYPFTNRPRHIAANVLRDTAHRLRRAHRREETTATTVDTVQSEDVAYRTIDLLDLAQRSLDRDGLALVLRTRVGGEEVTSLSAEMGCTAPALRERRRRAEQKLRAAIVRSTTDWRLVS